MPHLTVEYSGNVRDHLDAETLLRDLHSVMAEFPTFNIADVKSRCLRVEHFRSGAGETGGAFVHVRLEILSGRDAATKKAVSDRVLEVVRRTFAQSGRELRLDVTMEIRDMARDAYFKLARDPVA